VRRARRLDKERTMRAVGRLLIVTMAAWSLGVGHDQASAPQAASITVHDTVLGQTTTYIGATEAGVFYLADLTDLGINTYRLWTKMDELEWWDDDDAAAGYYCTQIGTPDIATIKADQLNGFVNVIPWDWWDEQFTGTYYQWSGNSREQVIQQCVNNGIMPIVVLRNRDDQNKPDVCSHAWAPDSPIDQGDLNEWWEHAFAIAYWLNVRHSYGATHFEVLNEPDLSSQGWHGTQAEYLQLVETAYDAVKFANDIAGIDTILHAPIVANYGSSYLAAALDGADDEIAVVDYHNYDPDPSASLSAVQATVAAHNPDHQIEPIWLSEWGTYTSTYDDLDRAILTAQQLLTFSEQGVEGVTLFGMYDWGSFSGLLDTSRNRSETYYAYRLMIRGLKGGKDRLEFVSSGLGAGARVTITTGGGKVYVAILNSGATPLAGILVDLADLGVADGSVSVFEYSSAHKDALVATPSLAAGQFSVDAPARSILLAEAEPSPTLIELTRLAATPYAGYVLVEWATASEIDTAGFNLWRAEAAGGDYAKLNAALIPARGGPTWGASYAYADSDVTPGVTYSYKLEDLTLNGQSSFHGPVWATAGLAPGPPYRCYLPLVVH
jgi:hypothetical protein